MARIKKSRVLNGFSYHFSDDKLIGIVNNADSAYPNVLDPTTNLFKTLAAAEEALTAYNEIKHGGNTNAYEKSIAENPLERLIDFFNEKEKQENNVDKNLKQNPYPNVNDGISNPSLAFSQYKDRSGPYALSDTYTDRDGVTQTTQLLTYPLDIDPSQDHMKITKYAYKRNEEGGASNVSASKPPRAEKQYEGGKGGLFGTQFGASPRKFIGYLDQPGDTMLGKRLMGSVLLPMPKVVDTNGAEWGESELNIFGLLAVQGAAALGVGKKSDAQIAEQLGIGLEEFKQVKDARKALKKDGSNIQKIFGGLGGAIGSATATEAIARTTGQSVTQDQVLARTGGQVLNPNAEMLFQGPVLRDFNFDFLMIARSREEGAEIRKIIKWFKSGMAPKYNSSTFLETPDIFTLEYKNGVGGNDILKTVNRFSPGGLALRTIAVDYATNGYWSAYQDSQPVAIKMSMNFAELRPIYSQDQNHKQMEGSVGY